MGDSEQRQLEEVAEDWSDALVASYKVCMRENNSSLGLDAELTQQFFNVVIAYLKARATKIFASSDDLEMSRTDDERITAEDREPSVGACMGFLSELFAYYQSDAAVTAYYPRSGEAAEKRLHSSRPSQRRPLTQEDSGR